LRVVPVAERPNIAMTDSEVRALLARAGEVVVAAIAPSGWPVATLAPARLDAARLAIDVAADDPLADSLVDDAAVCCVADEGASYLDIKGVIARGSVAGVETDGALRRVDVRIEHVVSFDFGKLPEARDT
jgi:hypothetical protein